VAAEFTDREKEDSLEYCQGSIYLVLEYVEHDLTGLIDRQYPYVAWFCGLAI
jgi:cyclin-dependent kinase 12/13